MSIEFPDLPYDIDALEPYVSARTLERHWGAHHRSYVGKLNESIAGTAYDGMTLEGIIATSKAKQDTGIYRNAAQAWNHAFLWHSMSPNGGNLPGADLRSTLENSFGSLQRFSDEFSKAAMSVFGSGWVWIVLEAGTLKVMTTGNADAPLGPDQLPLLTLDVWEHAYYLDYQNERAKYVSVFLEHLINWDFVSSNLASRHEAA